ncbi:MAG: hypothetical protein NUV46_03820 [Nanoarchaeota archaeon]|nr:hypothetical protein [Nanoarchaeota archaeon]
MEKDIGKIMKNDQSDIVLRIDDFAGKRGFTIREFVTSERYTGFTKAGVRILSKDFPKFKEMVNSITDEDMKEIEPSEDAKEQEEPKKVTKGKTKPKEELPDY